MQLSMGWASAGTNKDNAAEWCAVKQPRRYHQLTQNTLYTDTSLMMPELISLYFPLFLSLSLSLSLSLHMYMYIYLYVYVFIYICIYIHMYLYIYICIYIYIYTYIHIYIYIYTYRYIWAFKLYLKCMENYCI